MKYILRINLPSFVKDLVLITCYKRLKCLYYHLFFKNTKRTKKNNGLNIIIFSGIGDMYITPLEILIYHALRFKGHNVKYLINNSSRLNELVNSKIYERREAVQLLSETYKNAKKFLKSANVEYVEVEFNEDILNALNINKLSENEILNFIYDSINFGAIVKQTLFKFYKTLDLREFDLEVARSYLLLSLGNYLYLKDQNTYQKVDLLLCSHGIYSTWGALIQYCKNSRIKFACYDRAKSNFTFNFAVNRPAPDWTFDSAWLRYKDRALTPNEDGLVEKYLEDRISHKGDVFVYNTKFKVENLNDLRSLLGISKGALVITFFCNLVWDAANVSRDIAFDSFLDCIYQTAVAMSEREDICLLIRPHPAEKVIGTEQTYESIIRRKFRDNFPANLKIVPANEEINSFSIIELTDIAIVNTSTIGIELAIAAKPVILVSETHYRGKGFTYDICSRGMYFETLDSLINKKDLRKNQVQLAKKYFYMMMFLYQHKVPLHFYKNQFMGYGSSSFSQLCGEFGVLSLIEKLCDLDALDTIDWTSS